MNEYESDVAGNSFRRVGMAELAIVTDWASMKPMPIRPRVNFLFIINYETTTLLYQDLPQNIYICAIIIIIIITSAGTLNCMAIMMVAQQMTRSYHVILQFIFCWI